MPIRVRETVWFVAALVLPGMAAAQVPEWVQRSNAHAQVLLQPLSQFAPEQAGQFGVEGLDEAILDLGPGVNERARAALVAAHAELKVRLRDEKDPLVRQDLEILVERTDEFIEQHDVVQAHLLPYYNLHQTVFFGLRALLDDQVEAERRPRAVTRLRRYAGLEPGTTPVTRLAMDRTRERLQEKGLLGPVRAEVERDLANGAQFVGGIGQLFQAFGIAGYEEPFAALQSELDAYAEFVRSEILPRSRTDFKQPPELYALALRGSGIDMPVEELVARAQASFAEIRNEMRALAPLVARDRGFASSDYRDVIRELKKEQILGEAILPHYEARLAELETLIRDKGVVTLPNRPMRIRLASEAESAAIPAPNMRPPRLIGNTGEMGEFVLPLRVPGPAGEGTLQFDDFTNASASWTLSVHEGRPGHELQFASLVERGVSMARALFSFNSVNIEGWALYAEAEMKPYMPLDGQLMSLQHRLLRAARAILDPGLQMGSVTRDEALRILREEVVLSDAMANQEVERYTFRSPGQAPSYFCGYSRLLEIRSEAERRLGADFDRRQFHDFLLAQGTLPPKLLRRAVLETFVPQQRDVTRRPAAARR